MSAVCGPCMAYVERRGDAIAEAIAERYGPSYARCAEVSDRYMAGVHERHLAGLSLDTDGAA